LKGNAPRAGRRDEEEKERKCNRHEGRTLHFSLMGQTRRKGILQERGYERKGRPDTPSVERGRILLSRAGLQERRGGGGCPINLRIGGKKAKGGGVNLSLLRYPPYSEVEKKSPTRRGTEEGKNFLLRVAVAAARKQGEKEGVPDGDLKEGGIFSRARKKTGGYAESPRIVPRLHQPVKKGKSVLRKRKHRREKKEKTGGGKHSEKRGAPSSWEEGGRSRLRGLLRSEKKVKFPPEGGRRLFFGNKRGGKGGQCELIICCWPRKRPLSREGKREDFDMGRRQRMV